MTDLSISIWFICPENQEDNNLTQHCCDKEKQKQIAKSEFPINQWLFGKSEQRISLSPILVFARKIE